MDSSDDKLVKIVSAEGHEFFIDREVAKVSGTMKAMLESPFAESRGEINFPDISTTILESVIQYCHFKLRYANSNVPIPKFVFDKDNAIELLMAANFLDC